MREVESLEAHYFDLRHRLSTGALAPDQFHREVAKLWFEDAGGRTWMIGAHSGHWYVYQNDQWQMADAPRAAVPVETQACARCGEPIEAGASYCGQCGFRLPVTAGVPENEPLLIASSAPAQAQTARLATPKAPEQTVPDSTRLSRRTVATGTGLVVLTLCLVGAVVMFAFRDGSATLFAAAQNTPTVQGRLTSTRSPTATSGNSQNGAPTALVVAMETATPTPTPTARTSDATSQPVTSTPSPTLTPSNITPTGTLPPVPSATPAVAQSNTPRPPTSIPTVALPTATPVVNVSVRGRIAFAMLSSNRQNYDVFVASADGSGRSLVAPNSRQPQFNPSGARLVTTGMGDFRAKLFLRELSTGTEHGIENTPIEARNPAWSPDGNTVLFSSNEMEDRQPRLYVVDAKSLSDRRTTLRFGNTDLIGRYPSWALSGHILYSGCDVWAGGGQCGIIRVNPDGSAPAPLSSHRLDTAPAARGNTVAFMSVRDGNWEIYSVPLSGGQPRNLTNSPANEGLPTFSPDGQFIGFVSDRSGQWAVWVMRADGSNPRLLFTLDNGYVNGGDLDWTGERISWAP